MIEIKYEKDNNRAVALDTSVVEDVYECSAEVIYKQVGYCTYEIKEYDGAKAPDWFVTHTVVDPEYGGQGIAGNLVAEIMSQAREAGAKIVPVCSYVQKQFEKKEEYSDLLSDTNVSFLFSQI